MNKAIFRGVLVSVLAMGGCWSGLSLAQPAAPAAASAAMAVEPSEGEVRKVDRAKRKITLKHGEIKNLGMAPMAMEFEVKDRTSIDKLKVGDHVRFKASYVSGKYIVTEIRIAK